MIEINNELKKYIEENIFPEYQKNEKAHNIEHIKYVINRSFKFAETVDNINYDIVYTVAAFHDIGHHIVNIPGQGKRHKERETRVRIGKCAEQSKQQRCDSDACRLPLTEDHYSESQEAKACYTVFKFPYGNACQNIAQSSQASKRSGDQHTGPAHFVNADTDGSCRLWMLPTGHQPKSEAVLVKNKIYNDYCNYRNKHEPVEFKSVDIHNKHFSG